MLKAVTNALSNGNHLLVEAGTGVGKSFAYLVPAAMFAVQNNTRVVISTNTINLQDQLIKKDIPDLQAALNHSLSSDLRSMIEYEATAQGVAFSSEFHAAAVQDFLAKRPGSFQWPEART